MSAVAIVTPLDAHVAQARRILSRDIADSRRLTPRAQAEAAHYAGGPSVDDLERRIIEIRALGRAA